MGRLGRLNFILPFFQFVPLGVRNLLQEARAEQRNHRHRHHKRRQEGEAESHGQRGEKEFAHAIEKHHGEKVHDVHQGRSEDGQVHFRPAHFRGDPGQGAHL